MSYENSIPIKSWAEDDRTRDKLLKKLTQQLKHARVFLEIPVLDHLIAGENNYFSFADEGLL